MKYTSKELSDNVNVSGGHPLVELAWLAGGLVSIIAAIWLCLFLVTELVIPRVPVDVEVWAGNHLLGKQSHRENPVAARVLRRLLAALPGDSTLRRYKFSVTVAENDTVNALALPGGRIVVFSGLLKQIRSENELAMVLGHELGHFAHRDHLRGLGRGLGIALAVAMIFGRDSAAAGFSTNLVHGLEMRYSRRQEKNADAFGLDLLVPGYGHAGGATDFFSRLAGESGGKAAYILASHPHPEDRISALKKVIGEKGYRVGAGVPFPGLNGDTR